MIPFSICNPPTIFKASILLILIQLLPLSLQINQTNHHKQSTTSNPHYTNHNSTSFASRMPVNPQKRLQRLPHIFSRILELPLRSTADVFIEDKPDCFWFTTNIEDGTFAGQVKAYAVKIHPGVMKVVVRKGDGGEVELLEKLKADVWRFRLPAITRPELAITRPELATAVVIGRELVVTVPKGGA